MPRKKRGEGDPKPFQVPLYPDERVRFDAAAAEERRTLSEWMREACEEKVKRQKRRI